MHDFAKRIHEIAQLVYDSYIRRREACMDWMTLGGINDEAHGQKLMPYPLSRGPVR